MSNQQLDIAAEETGSPSSPFASSSKFGYVGDRDNAGKKSGRGRLAYKNGDIYEGNWLNDKKHGERFYSYENEKFSICLFSISLAVTFLPKDVLRRSS